MISRILLVAVSAGLLAATFAADAQAKKRFHLPFFGSFLDDDDTDRPAWRSNRRIDYPDDLSVEEYDRMYGNKFDREYYEPDYQPPVRKSAKPVTGKDAPAKKKLVSTPPKPSTATAAPAKTAAAISCDKATSIITGYGFSEVKPADCEGQVYAFNAARGGKTYAIKLNAVNGELTEVKKVQ